MSDHNVSRRRALEAAGAILAGTVAEANLAASQTSAVQRNTADVALVRLTPRAELINTLEYEEEAKKKLAPATYALIAGGDRAPDERVLEVLAPG